MEIAIIGFPQSGETTVFRALTGGKGEAAGRGGARASLGNVKVPDPRLDTLFTIFKAKKLVQAEVTYLDIPSAPAGLGKGKGIEGQFLNDLSRMDALVHVIGAFQSPGEDTAQADRIQEEAASMELELALSDLSIIERRLGRIESSLKGSKPQDRDAARKEGELLVRLKAGLEEETPVREQTLSPEERQLLQNFQLLTAKPLMAVLNIAEGDLPQAGEIERACMPPGGAQRRVIALCGKLEAEMVELEHDEAAELMELAGIQETSLRRLIRLSYDALQLVTFLTASNEEVRAWSVHQDTTAPEAAGKIHTDLQRGFIRAEVVGFDELAELGGVPEARKRGVLRLEGKGYVIREGDVVTFLFNV